MRIVLFILALLVSPTPVWASEYMMLDTKFEYHGPGGFTALCKQKPQICRKDDQGQQRVELTIDKLIQLEQLNNFVNRLMIPTNDTDKHGVPERWELLNCLNQKDGDCRGDCEEYVLLKRQFLIEAGWPVSALLITAVYDEKNEGHAVLTVRTSGGDFVLDNKRDEVLLWSELPYRFNIRQSSLDPKIWYLIKPRKQKVAVSSWSKGTKVPPVR